MFGESVMRIAKDVSMNIIKKKNKFSPEKVRDTVNEPVKL